MRPGQIRRFRLVDGMVVIGSIAAGLALNRYASKYDPPPEDSPWFFLAFRLVSANLFFLKIAVVVLSLSPPRPRLSLLVRRPGFIACLALMLSDFIDLVKISKYIIFNNNRFDDIYELMIYGRGSNSVLVAWGVLAIVKGWRPDSSWLDRLGRLIGILWILWDALELARDFAGYFKLVGW